MAAADPGRCSGGGGTAAFLVLLHPVWAWSRSSPHPFSSLVSLQVGGFNIGGMESLLALILFAWLVRMAVRREIVIPIRRCCSLAAMVGAILLSWLEVLSLGDALTETVKWLEMLALYLFIVATVERRHMPWLVGLCCWPGQRKPCSACTNSSFAPGRPASSSSTGGSARLPARSAAQSLRRLPGPGAADSVQPSLVGGRKQSSNVKRQTSAVSHQRSAVSGQRSATPALAPERNAGASVSGQRSAVGYTPYSSLLTPYFLLPTPYPLCPLPAFGLMLVALYASSREGMDRLCSSAGCRQPGARRAVGGNLRLVVAVVAIAGAVATLACRRRSPNGSPTYSRWPASPMSHHPGDRCQFCCRRAAGSLASGPGHVARPPLAGAGFGNYATIYPPTPSGAGSTRWATLTTTTLTSGRGRPGGAAELHPLLAKRLRLAWQPYAARRDSSARWLPAGWGARPSQRAQRAG